jgi:hypothetical protein
LFIVPFRQQDIDSFLFPDSASTYYLHHTHAYINVSSLWVQLGSLEGGHADDGMTLPRGHRNCLVAVPAKSSFGHGHMQVSVIGSFFLPSQNHISALSSQYHHKMVLPVAIATKTVVYKCAWLSYHLESLVD